MISFNHKKMSILKKLRDRNWSMLKINRRETVSERTKNKRHVGLVNEGVAKVERNGDCGEREE